MRNHISYTALGVALLAGASVANAQTVIAAIADRPAGNRHRASSLVLDQ